MSDATQDVLEKLDTVFLPEEAERPLILHYDPSLDPVMELSLSGEGTRFEDESGLRRLRRLAELQIKKELEPDQGCRRGYASEAVWRKRSTCCSEEEALRRTGISIQQVIDRLAQENINVAGGTLRKAAPSTWCARSTSTRTWIEIADTIVDPLRGSRRADPRSGPGRTWRTRNGRS